MKNDNSYSQQLYWLTSQLIDTQQCSWLFIIINSEGVLSARAALTDVISLGINTRRVYFMMLFITDRGAAYFFSYYSCMRFS